MRTSSAPSISSDPTSCAAATFFSSSFRQLANRSVHRLDREPPFAGPVERHRAVPAIIVEHVAERHTRRAALAGWPDEGPRRQRVVPVLEDVGAHPQLVTHQSLDRVAAGIDDRSDAADDQTGRIRVGDALGDASRVHGTHCSAIRFGRKPPWAAGDARHTASPVPSRWE